MLTRALPTLLAAACLLAAGCGGGGDTGDDDDDTIDAGHTPTADASGECTPTGVETCNGQDDDCDGVVDEPPEAVDACDLAGASSVACVAGACQVVSCEFGLDDCDGAGATGCEAALTTLEHCGACDTPCARDNATVSCAEGSCEVVACLDGWADCDGDEGTGCETDLTAPGTCGSCTEACEARPHTTTTCTPSGCTYACVPGWADCDLDPLDGCETDLATGVLCYCTPYETRPCFSGAPATEGIGACHAGTQTCAATGTGWGLCTGEVIATPEVCANGVDEDCNGVTDDAIDADGDGWPGCMGGDCCDDLSDGCADPAKVNPGAFDFAGNSLDDDCNGVLDDPTPTSCSTGADFSGVTGTDLAQAMDLCQFTTESPPLAERRWGVISASLLHADGTGAPDSVQVGVLSSFGVVPPQANATFAVIASGTARDEGDTGYVYPNGIGYASASSVSAPADYLAAHGGVLQTALGCPNGDAYVNDSVQLALRIRVPTNAQGISFKFRFYSAEYPEWVCTAYNDFFLAMHYTGAAGIPADKNISFDSAGNPVSVNNAFFDVCSGCAYGTADLTGTGYPATDAGATTWLTTNAPVVPGEVMTIRFHTWDTSDHAWDSLVILDRFEWLIAPTEVITIQ